MADNVPVTPGAGATIATDDIGAVHHPYVKVEFGADGTATKVDDAAPLPVREPRTGAATVVSVGDSVAAVTLKALNGARLGLFVYNNSGAVLYLKYGSAASPTDFTVKIGPDGFWEMPKPTYTGIVTGAWASDAGGAALVTEL